MGRIIVNAIDVAAAVASNVDENPNLAEDDVDVKESPNPAEDKDDADSAMEYEDYSESEDGNGVSLDVGKYWIFVLCCNQNFYPLLLIFFCFCSIKRDHSQTTEKL